MQVGREGGETTKGIKSIATRCCEGQNDHVGGTVYRKQQYRVAHVGVARCTVAQLGHIATHDNWLADVGRDVINVEPSRDAVVVVPCREPQHDPLPTHQGQCTLIRD